uniref:Uncharacterized protein n=1 Tax=Lepisosteus oculatus TaxID=7918 RepID=W5MGL4_LEPOC
EPSTTVQYSYCSGCAYCVNNDGWKLFFGSGTRLQVQPRKENTNPSAYVLASAKGPGACLATDFGSYNTTISVNGINSGAQPSLIEGEKAYSMVKIMQDPNVKCEVNFGNGSVVEAQKDDGLDLCSTAGNQYFQTDEKINFLSLTVLVLRVLFLKSIGFNVLMTIRMWGS